jgi:hypothetical protein
VSHIGPMLSITGLAWYAGVGPEGQHRLQIRELRRTLDKLGVGPDRYQILDRWTRAMTHGASNGKARCGWSSTPSEALAVTCSDSRASQRRASI